MIEKLLRAKHWQLFLLTFGLPFLMQFVFMGFIFTSMMDGPGSLSIFNNMMFIFLISLVCMGALYTWFWAVGIGLQKYMPEEIHMNLTRFKTFFLFPVFYLLFFFAITFWQMKASIDGYLDPDPITMVSLMTIVVPLHFFAMFCIFYCLYFISKTIKTVELQRETSFSDFAGEFFLIWFYPIGIWIIQPRINKILEYEENEPYL